MADQPTNSPTITVGFVAAFYGALAGLAWLLAAVWGDLNLLVWHNLQDTALWADALVGAVFGVLVVVASAVLDRTAGWAKRLGQNFGRTLGELSTVDALLFAVASGIGEELFFRGFLQQVFTDVLFDGAWANAAGLIVATVIFGGLHIGPDPKKYWPWTAMSLVLGAGLGGMYLYTGNVLAPIVAHFTINFFNLQSIGRRYGHLKDQPQ